MASQTLIFGIQLAPGDEPRALEQINGDLLIPAAGRPTLEKALLAAEEALPPECKEELQALVDARRLLGIVKPDRERERLLNHLVTVKPI
jgi:hypothetical protein